MRNDIEVTTNDKLIVLSTCTPDSRDDLRFITVGVFIGEIEE